MRTLALTAWLLGVSWIAAAPHAAGQAATIDHPWAGGVRVGAGVSSWLGTTGDSLHLGAALGGFVTHRIRPGLAIQSELIIHDKGADFVDASGQPADQALLYAELPVFARYDVPLGELVSVYGLAGPGLAILIDSKRLDRDQLRPFDVTVTAGLGVDLYTPARYVSFDVRAGLGLIDALSDGDRSARPLVVTALAGVEL